MRFKVGDRIHHRDNQGNAGVILNRSEREKRYYISWHDKGKRAVHTQEFIEENYVAESSGRK